MSKLITQKLNFKHSVVKFSLKYGVSKASKKFEINRRTIYRWIKQGLYHAMIRIEIYKKSPKKGKKVQPPEVPIATYPGERVQIDVKYVPREYLPIELREKGVRYYQYTAIEEYTRLRYLYTILFFI